MKQGKILLGLLLTAIAFTMILGCGGGGGGTGGVGTSSTAVNLTVTGVTSTTTLARTANITTVSQLTGNVTVYDFKTGNVITTGSLVNQVCTVSVTPGLTVAVVITGQENGKNYRLSTIIPLVPNADEHITLNPATSIAAEAIAQKHFRKGEVIDDSTFQNALSAAQDYLNSHPSADISLSGGLMQGTAFGASGNLTMALSQVVNVVPDVLDNKLVLAKNGVTAMGEMGLPVKALLTEEPQDLHTVVTTSAQQGYSALINRLRTLIAPALGFGKEMYYNGDPKMIFSLQLGEKYQATYDSSNTGNLILTDAGAAPESDEIVITLTTGGTTYTLVATEGQSAYTLTQTSSSDPQENYSVSLAINSTNLLTFANPSVDLGLSFKDQHFTDPLTYKGNISAVGPDYMHFTKFIFSGSLRTPQVQHDGTFELDFASPSSLPAGASTTPYSYPTLISFTNTDLTVVTGNGATVKMSGGASLALAVVTDGSGVAEVPQHFELSGTYTNSLSGLNFDGSIVGNWSNPNLSGQTVDASLDLHGELTRQNHPSYYLDIKNTVASNVATSNIDLKAGTSSLTGTVTADIVSDTVNGLPLVKLTNPKLDLVNQDGVELNLSSDSSGVSGSIKSGPNKDTVATITQQDKMLKITYTDSTFYEIPM